MFCLKTTLNIFEIFHKSFFKYRISFCLVYTNVAVVVLALASVVLVAAVVVFVVLYIFIVLVLVIKIVLAVELSALSVVLEMVETLIS